MERFDSYTAWSANVDIFSVNIVDLDPGPLDHKHVMRLLYAWVVMASPSCDPRLSFTFESRVIKSLLFTERPC